MVIVGLQKTNGITPLNLDTDFLNLKTLDYALLSCFILCDIMGL